MLTAAVRGCQSVVMVGDMYYCDGEIVIHAKQSAKLMCMINPADAQCWRNIP